MKIYMYVDIYNGLHIYREIFSSIENIYKNYQNELSKFWYFFKVIEIWKISLENFFTIIINFEYFII